MNTSALVQRLKPVLPLQARAAIKVGPRLLRGAGVVLAVTPNWMLAGAAVAGTMIWYRRRKARAQ